jgi:membrane-bound ClpP family serine protease
MFSKTDIEKYFIAEKLESLVFLIIGIIAVLAAIAFYFFIRSAFFKGAALPLLLIGIIQLVVGYTVYMRSDSDRSRNVYAYDMNPGELRSAEIPRMEKVNKNFVVYRWIEIALFAAGVILILVHGRNPEGRGFWYGFGMALAIQSFLMLSADYFAEKRALNYTRGLKEFTKSFR